MANPGCICIPVFVYIEYFQYRQQTLLVNESRVRNSDYSKASSKTGGGITADLLQNDLRTIS